MTIDSLQNTSLFSMTQISQASQASQVEAEQAQEAQASDLQATDAEENEPAAYVNLSTLTAPEENATTNDALRIAGSQAVATAVEDSDLPTSLNQEDEREESGLTIDVVA